MLNKIIKSLKANINCLSINNILFILFLIFTISISIYGRFTQLEVWKQLPDRFFTENIPMMTTLDSYKFYRHAYEFDKNIYDTEKMDPMIFYPDIVYYPDVVPLLSVILSYLSNLTEKSLYDIGIYLIPILSSLFIIPLAIYFYIIGYPYIGILGGLIATFIPMYYGRTSIGRVDTDSLNIFFLILASLFVMLAGKDTANRKKVFIYSALTGITVGVFYWWYHHGMFNIAYLGILFLTLLFGKAKIKDIAISLIIYIILSNPIFMYNAFFQLYHAIHIYIVPIKSTDATQFPNVYDTISEAQKSSWLESLKMVTKNPYIALIGIGGFILFSIQNILKSLPLTPIILLGTMTFISAVRFSMFLGPIVGIGLGYLVYIAITFIPKTIKNYNKLITSLGYLAISLIFLLITITGNSAFKQIPGASIHPKIFKMFLDMKTELPKDSAIYTWWDYGLAIAEATGFPVFHSGMTQETPKTWLIAKSLTSNQNILYNTISYLDTYGIGEVEYLASYNVPLKEILNRVTSYAKGPINKDDYILITQDMIGKYSPISYLASKDPITQNSNPKWFNRLNCTSFNNNILSCTDTSINLSIGLINNKAPIVSVIFTSKGNFVKRNNYNFTSGYALIINTENSNITDVYLMEKDLLDTAFTQLYFLNQPNTNYFSILMDRYPYGRLYKVKKKENNIN